MNTPRRSFVRPVHCILAVGLAVGAMACSSDDDGGASASTEQSVDTTPVEESSTTTTPLSPSEKWSIAETDLSDNYVAEAWSDTPFEATDMKFLPNGQALVITKGGWFGPGEATVNLLDADGTFVAELMRRPVCADAERGMLGLEVDPEFATNSLIYIFYTQFMNDCTVTDDLVNPPTQPVYSRVSSFVFDPAGIDPASEVVLLDELPSLKPAHHSGGLAFMPDGTLLVTVGEAGYRRSGDLDLIAGKVLRIDVRNPTVAPAGNPYADDTSDSPKRLVYASGFRNAFRIAVDPDTSRIAVGDVGTNDYEEVNVVEPGATYGYPAAEGPFSDNGSALPALWYRHADECVSVIGGAFVPQAFVADATQNMYTFTDLGCQFVRAVEFEDGVATRLVRLSKDLDIAIANMIWGPDEALYLVGVGSGPVPIMRLSLK